MNIADHARDIILVIGFDGIIRDCNRAAERAYNFSRAELRGKHIVELRAPETTVEVPEQMARAIAEGGILFETVHRRAGGESFPCEVSSQSAEVDGQPVLVSVIRDVSDRHLAERRLRAVEERFRLLLDSLPDGVLIHRDRILFANRTLLGMLGYERADELLGRSPLSLVVSELRDEVRRRIERLTSGEVPSVSQREHRLYRKGEREVVTVEVWAQMIDFEGAPANIAILHNVTEHRRLEAQLRQAQKMEAVGRLAGGVAHDFNNILTAIQGQGELLAAELSPGSSPQRHAQHILSAARRGGALTAQLLAFSRKQVLQPRVIDLNQTVTGLDAMLRRVIGEDVRLVTELDPRPCAVFADAGQLEQVIVNLAVNARDAMPDGGDLQLRTQLVESGDARAVLLEVADTGCGIDEATKSRLFEPFFTTKPRGKGTGLGLAMVYGIVTQSGGAITVESEPGHGARFRVRLPAAAEVPAAQSPPRVTPAERGLERLLVVEDDADVRHFLHEVLEGQGYRVLTAHDGAEALVAAQSSVERGEGVALVITDVIMPRMSGVELAERLRATLVPPPKVLFITGYPGEAAMGDRGPLLTKPFSVSDLARRVRAILDGQ